MPNPTPTPAPALGALEAIVEHYTRQVDLLEGSGSVRDVSEHRARIADARAALPAITAALSQGAADAARLEAPPRLVPPFTAYEDYEGGLHLIDATTRVVLSDAYAYDASAEERMTRMEWLAAALNRSTLDAAHAGGTHG